uniref:Secreted protein n=1 Tax=Ditylenchus dipsaci TaxID=166011 RepID=A0A915E392_9BILA
MMTSLSLITVSILVVLGEISGKQFTSGDLARHSPPALSPLRKRHPTYDERNPGRPIATLRAIVAKRAAKHSSPPTLLRLSTGRTALAATPLLKSLLVSLQTAAAKALHTP